MTTYQITIDTTDAGATATLTHAGRKTPIHVATRAAGSHLPAPARAIFAVLHGAGLAILVGDGAAFEIHDRNRKPVAFDAPSLATLKAHLRA